MTVSCIFMAFLASAGGLYRRNHIDNSVKNTHCHPLFTPSTAPCAVKHHSCPPHHPNTAYLQSVGEELVELGHLVGDGKVDGAVGNLDNETTDNLWVDLESSSALPHPRIWKISTNLVDNLEGLAGGDELGLGKSGLEAVDGLVVQLLQNPIHQPSAISIREASLTVAEVMVAVISPRWALMRVPNFSMTPLTNPRRLCSAMTSSKFLTVLSEPALLITSAMMPDLSSAERVGEARMMLSFLSLARTALSCWRALSVVSRLEVFAQAVY